LIDGPLIQAVVLDLDDTLYLERQYVRSGYDAVAEHLRGRRGRADRFEEWLWQRFCSGRTAGAFDALSEAFGLHLTADGIAELVAVYRGHSPRIEPRPEAEGVLRALRGGGRRVGLLTDGYLPAQRLKLQALGLERLFDAVVFTEELGRDCWKPSPAGFEAMAGLLGAPHPRCAYVADNPAKDFLAGNQLG